MKVSALTIIHNRVDLFAETIRSVLEQSHPVHELIVVDDGSTEDVKQVIDGFKDPRIRYFYYERIGVISKLRNIAVSKSAGDIMAFIDSDDLWHKDKVKIHLEKIQESGAVISFSDCQFFNSKGLIGSSVCEKLYGKEVNIFRELTEHNLSLAFGTNLFFQKEIDGQPVRFDEKLFVGEHDLVLRFSAIHKSVFIGQVLNYIRRHDRNTTVPGYITDLICPLEYNRTLDKLLGDGLLTKSLYKRIKAANYANAGGYYINKKHYKKSRQYLAAALKLDFRFYYLKIFLKIVLLSFL